jgi:hypothetical protein
LAILVGFNSIANLLVGHIRNTPEPRDRLVLRVPSALRPFILVSER